MIYHNVYDLSIIINLMSIREQQYRDFSYHWGVGGVLSQLDNERHDHSTDYFSKTLLLRERQSGKGMLE